MRLKELRLEKNLTQLEVGQAIGTSQRNIGRWENGENEPAAFYVKALADFFNVSTDYLLGIEDDFGAKIQSTPAPSTALTAEERELLEGYREINAAGKKLVMQTVQTLRNSAAGKSAAKSTKTG